VRIIDVRNAANIFFIFKFKNAFLTLFYFPNDNQLVQQIAQVAPETRNSQEWM